MKRIGLLSDTHAYLDPQLQVFFHDCDEIWHAGDVGALEVIETLEHWKPLRCVYGNIDDHRLRAEFPEVLCFECEQVRVVMTHIGGTPTRYKPLAMSAIERYNPKLFICGHSHILKVQYDKKYDLLFINPGAAGKHGFHHVQTAVRFVIDKDTIKDLEVIELETRDLGY